MFDCIIKNVRIIDGTSAPWYLSSVALKDGRIDKIGTFSAEEENTAKEVVDGEGLYLSPGFIDLHSHSDVSLLEYPLAESRILQGVTTVIG